MATFALVGAQDDIASLIKLSLESHHVPVTDVFNIFEELTNMRFIGVATPLLEDRGAREAYFKVFTALEDETFSNQTFLRLHTLVLSDEEVQGIRKLLKTSGAVARLPKLAHLGDVVVYPAEDAKTIVKSGMLTVSSLANGSLQVMFAPLDGAGFAKPKVVSGVDQLRQVLRRLNSVSLDLTNLTSAGFESRVVSCSLESLYSAGLI